MTLFGPGPVFLKHFVTTTCRGPTRMSDQNVRRPECPWSDQNVECRRLWVDCSRTRRINFARSSSVNFGPPGSCVAPFDRRKLTLFFNQFLKVR
jgi:hypothetical protein